jgi:hypothetical protein
MKFCSLRDQPHSRLHLHGVCLLQRCMYPGRFHSFIPCKKESAQIYITKAVATPSFTASSNGGIVDKVKEVQIIGTTSVELSDWVGFSNRAFC